MKAFKILSSSMIGLLVVFSLFTAAFAAEPVKTKALDPAATKVEMVKPLKLSADLVLQYIEYFNCPCALNQTLNTDYVSDMIAVKVGNPSSLNSVGAKITVSYYNIPTSSMVTVSKTITLNANQWTKVIMVQKPLLIGKTQGVTAVIEHTNLNIVDPNLANNRSVQKTCGQMVE